MKKTFWSDFLTGFSAAGSIGIFLSTIEATVNASKEWDEEDSIKDKALKSWKHFIFPASLTASTMASSISSNKLNKIVQTDILGVCCWAMKNRKDYKAALASVTDDETAEAVEIIVDDGYVETYVKTDPDKIVVVDNYLKIPFEAYETDILEAEYELNRTYRKRHYASLYDFYRYLGVPETSLAKKFGWSIALMEDAKDPEFNVDWIDFKHFWSEDKNGNKYLVLGYEYEPVFGYLMEEL